MTNPTAVLDAFRLDERVAVVTGASRGIGKAIALALASAGADVALLARDEATLSPVAREIEGEFGRRTAALALDVADLEAHAGVVEAIIERLGQIDILVNNAGMAIREEAIRFTLAEWD